MSLSEKNKRFVKEYLVDLNATQAAIRCGYSVKTARSIACELLTKPDIEAEIARIGKKVEEDTLVTTEYIINGFKNVAQRCQQAEPVMAFDEEAKEMRPTGEWKFDSSGANKALECLGRYKKLFTDKLIIENFDELAEKLLNARGRVSK